MWSNMVVNIKSDKIKKDKPTELKKIISNKEGDYRKMDLEKVEIIIRKEKR